MAVATTNGRRITRADLESAFAQALGVGEEKVQSKLPQIVVAAAAVTVTVLALTYMAGRRRGRKRSAVLEIRRL
ncbi:MAG TPA: hypothetical protein VKG43_06325 [Acidimicrobiales bacterium]|nr:hypothetical protein [Acidimicrobiales bacterium]